MKILIFVPHSLTVFGGFERVANYLVSYLKSQDVEVVFCSLFPEDEVIPDKKLWVEPFRNNRVIIIKYSWSKSLGKRFSRWFGKLKISDSTLDYSQVRDADIAIISQRYIVRESIEFLRQIGFKAKLVGWFHNSIYERDNSFKRLLRKLIFRWHKVYHCLSLTGN